jgi:siderophore synthetase component
MLNTDPNIPAPDDFYEALINLHRDLSPEQSRLVNAKLILLLANHIGDTTILSQAMAKAREGVTHFSLSEGEACPGHRSRIGARSAPGEGGPAPVTLNQA